MKSLLSNILWYDRMQLRLETCRREAMLAGDPARARRLLLLRLWANDRADCLSRSV